MDSESTTPSRGRGSLLVWFLVLVLLIGYPLSVGPALALAERNNANVPWVLYEPIAYLYKNVPAVKAFYDWYIPLWFKPPPPVRTNAK
jgi:hypothetical protein